MNRQRQQRWLGWLAIGWLVGIGSATQAGERFVIATLNCEFLVRRTLHAKFDLPLFEREWSADQKQVWKTPGYRDDQYRKAVQAAARLIHRIDADVMVLCEVGNAADVQELRDAVAELGLDYPHTALGDLVDTVTFQQVALFSKRPLTAIETSIIGREGYDKELDDVEEEDETGVSKGVHAVVAIGAQQVHLFALHLKSERGGHDADAQRIAQASIVRRHCIRHLEAGHHVIVAGDLNDDTGHPTLRRLRGRDDIWEDLHHTWSVRFFDKDALDTRYSYVYQGFPRQIDHILLSPSIIRVCNPKFGIRAKTMTVTETIDGTDKLVTDHRPLIVTLDWIGQAPSEPIPDPN